MKKIFIICIFTIIIAGCTKNQITIENSTNEIVWFNFRAKIYQINAGTPVVLDDDIPNGTFAYTSGHQPYTSTGEAISSGSGLSGSIYFNRHKTEQYILYWAAVDSTGYTLNAVVSTSDPQGSVAAP